METMKVYGSNAIRNVAFVGHGASGKTSLVDALAWVSGSSRRHGGIKDGTTLTDYSPDEIERKHSINLALGYAEWLDAKINLIDTPVKAHLTPKVVPVEVPIGDGPDFHGIINLFSGHCHNYTKGTAKGEYEVVPIPPEYQQRYQEYNEQLIEAVASTDDVLIERYLGGEEIPREQFIGAVKKAMLAGQIVPLFCGSSTLTYGLRTLLKKMVELLPAPTEVVAADAAAVREAPLLGRVFKTISEAHVGDVTLFRLYNGELTNGAEVWNAEHETAEKLNHLSIQQGKERVEVERLHAGDIGSVAKLRDTHTGDTFCQRDHPVRLPPLPL
ncbi:MAG: hypothetical protein JF602_05400, partial [Gemmatimonadetes bacterium]|nr:hypothetical protein [Gemmatimonadota bacterium]